MIGRLRREGDGVDGRWEDDECLDGGNGRMMNVWMVERGRMRNVQKVEMGKR